MFRLHALIFLFFLFVSLTIKSQSISDSLYKTLPLDFKPLNQHHITGEEKRRIITYADEFTQLSNVFINAELDKLATQLEKEATYLKDTAIKINNYEALGHYYYYYKTRSDEKKWYKYYALVIKHAANNLRFEKQTARAYLGVGAYYLGINKYEDCYDYYNKALTIYSKLNDTIGLSFVHDFSYPLYTSLYLYRLAINELDLMAKCTTIDDKKSGAAKFLIEEHYQDKALIYLDWYEFFGHKNLIDSATYYMDITPLGGEEGERRVSFHYFLKGYKSFLLKDYTQAITYLDSSLSMEEYYSEMIPNKFIYKGISLLKLGKSEEGKKILLDKKLMATENELMSMAYDALYKDASDNKKYMEALHYSEIANKYKDSIAVVAARGKVFEMMQKHSMVEKEIRIKNLELIDAKRNEQRNLIIITFVAISIALLAIIIALFNRGKKRKWMALEAATLLDKEKRNMEDIVRLQERDLQRVRKKAIYNFRKKISRDLHDELSSALAGLKYYVNDLRLKEKDVVKQNLLFSIEQEVESVYLQARSYMHNLNKGIEEVVVSLNPFLQNISRDLLKKTDLEIKLKYDKAEVESRLSVTHQTQLTLMLKEAMSNILKHSGATQIEISIWFNDNNCQFSIKDNGRGFGKSILEKGLGMESMQLRIKRIKGQTFMQSSVEGTIIEGSFPLV